MPARYTLIRVARWLGCGPWELLEQDPAWYADALEFMHAEALGEREGERRDEAISRTLGSG